MTRYMSHIKVNNLLLRSQCSSLSHVMLHVTTRDVCGGGELGQLMSTHGIKASQLHCFLTSYHHVLSRAHLFPPNSGLPKGSYSLSETEERV